MAEDIKNKQREPFWDFVKGVAILLMLLGHSIQFGQGLDYFQSYACFDSYIFKCIYGFHMPLFMLVSGFLFYNSIQKRNLFELVKNLFFRIVVPLLSFSIISFIILKHNGISSLNLIPLIKSTIHHFLSSLWFLWAVLYSSLLLGVSNKLKIDRIWIQTVMVAALYCIPDYLNTCNFKFMYPYFLFGYFVKKNNLLQVIRGKELITGIFSIGIYLLLITLFYTSDTYIYTTQIYIFKGDGVSFHLYNDALRLIVGFLGIAGCISLLKYMYDKAALNQTYYVLTDLGRKSLGIYCFQDLIVSYIPKITPPNTTPMLTLFITFVGLLIISYSLTKICNSNKILNSVFLGGRN